MEMKDLLKRINELANKKKTIGLNEEELQERTDLRALYLKIFREGFDETLKSVKVVDPKGNDVTPEKLVKAKSKKLN